MSVFYNELQCFFNIECQTDVKWSTVEAKINKMEKSLNENHFTKLTHYYTGLTIILDLLLYWITHL